MKHLLSILTTAVIILFAAQPVVAQDEADYEVVLPEAAQTCVLPAAPDAIPEGAGKEELLAAKKALGEFQPDIQAYRDCLAAAETGEITPGNQQAIVASYNYSVEMEERAVNRFNEALRAWKAQQGEG